MKIIVVGATGLVGRTILKVLEERRLEAFSDYLKIIPAASERSAGTQVSFRGKAQKVVTVSQALDIGADLAIFSAGAIASREWAPRFAAKGIRVIDNSSAWRREVHVPLVVPEVNAESIRKEDHIIANPNCSTIQMVAALAPLHRAFTIDRIVVSTYQSVTGSGIGGVKQLDDERAGREGPRVYPHPIDLNLIPQGGSFLENGDTTEEDKLIFETRKIFNEPGIRLSATVVRVPVKGGHSEAVNVTFRKGFEVRDVIGILRKSPGLVVLDDPENSSYPTPLVAEGKDEVFVGRIRRDTSGENALNLWIVADNLRKGAATNAVQIAEYLAGKFY